MKAGGTAGSFGPGPGPQGRGGRAASTSAVAAAEVQEAQIQLLQKLAEPLAFPRPPVISSNTNSAQNSGSNCISGAGHSASTTPQIPHFVVSDSLSEKVQKIYSSVSAESYMLVLQDLIYQKLANSYAEGESIEVTQRNILAALGSYKMKEVLGKIAVSYYEKGTGLRLTRPETEGGGSVRARTAEGEAVVCLRDVRLSWEQGINDELRAMAKEMRRPFARSIPPGAQHPLLEASVSMSAREKVRFLFDSEDLLETAAAVRSPNMSRLAVDRTYGMLKVPLNTPNLATLSKRYQELHVSSLQMGLDESHARFGFRFQAAKHAMAEETMRSAPLDTASARKMCRTGAPPSLRGQIWRMALGLSPFPTYQERVEYERLVNDCKFTREMLTDDLYVMDVLSVCDDTNYFVFDDNMREVALCFSRDGSVLSNAEYLIHSPLYMRGADEGSAFIPGANSNDASPPNGVQPFVGFGRYIAPVCFLFPDNLNIFSTLREMYCRLWCGMNVISSNPGTFYHVCQTFEKLLLDSDIKLFSHLLKLNIQPLQVAAPWIQLGFVGLLEIEQVLVLWDRIIGFMDTTLLAVLAAAIFQFRSEALMLCTTDAQALSVLGEGSRLRVAPLIQTYLLSSVSY